MLDIREKDNYPHKSNHRRIWRKLFVDGILRQKFVRPQYWVIDALDECTNHAELVPLLLKAVEISSIRIFVPSRDRFEPQRYVILSKARVLSEDIQVSDTKLDIKLYLEANMNSLPSIDKDGRQEMINSPLAKSNGCFLRVRLVLQE